jgi:CheY-like chemotaxis protein
MSAPIILVADRDPLQRQLIDLLLAEDHYVVVGVESGKQALEYVRENTPDLAILDTDLGDIGGADVCEKMKSVTRLNPVPVILTTPHRGSTGLDARTKSLAHFVGADLALQKPLGDKNMRRHVAELIDAGKLGAAGEKGSITHSSNGSLHSTGVIEAAIRAIPGGAAGDPGLPPGRDQGHAHEIEALRSKVEQLENQLAQVSVNDGVGRSGRLPLKVQTELDDLRKRVEKQRRMIEELKRRNHLLIETLEEEKNQPRGLFGRRRSA